MKIFLIAGKAGSGKLEVAKLIESYYLNKNQKSVITEYSKYIKKYAEELLGWDNFASTKPRKFLQDIGSFIRYNLKKPTFFTDRMKEDILVYENFADILIICDVRYPDELEEIKNNYQEVYTIKVINEFGNNALTDEQKCHPTETTLDNYFDFSYTIHNKNLESVKKDLYSFLEGK